MLVDTSVRPADTIAMSSAGWRSDVLVDTATGAVDFHDHPGELVGQPDWYLERPGFWHGACGPAACWAGGAIGLVDEARVRIDDDPHRLAHLGAMVAAAWSPRALLTQAGNEIDREPTDTVAGERRARALRWTVERSVTDVIDRFGRAFRAPPPDRIRPPWPTGSPTSSCTPSTPCSSGSCRAGARPGIRYRSVVKLDLDDRLSALTHRRTYFDELYRTRPRSLGIRGELVNERRKRDITMAVLPNPRVNRACGRRARLLDRDAHRTARRTRRRADRVDFVAEAAHAARCRVERPEVTIVEAAFPVYWPAGTGDLVVWSEVAYYLTESGFDLAMKGLAGGSNRAVTSSWSTTRASRTIPVPGIRWRCGSIRTTRCSGWPR